MLRPARRVAMVVTFLASAGAAPAMANLLPPVTVPETTVPISVRDPTLPSLPPVTAPPLPVTVPETETVPVVGPVSTDVSLPLPTTLPTVATTVPTTLSAPSTAPPPPPPATSGDGVPAVPVTDPAASLGDIVGSMVPVAEVPAPSAPSPSAGPGGPVTAVDAHGVAPASPPAATGPHRSSSAVAAPSRPGAGHSPLATVPPPGDRLGVTWLRQAATASARQFSFPLGLAALVGLFLVVQGRVDGRDPKLRAGAGGAGDSLEFR